MIRITINLLIILLLLSSVSYATIVDCGQDTIYTHLGEMITVPVFVRNVDSLGALTLTFTYDHTMLRYDGYEFGSFWNDQQGPALLFPGSGEGWLSISCAVTHPDVNCMAGSGEIFRFRFEVIADNATDLVFDPEDYPPAELRDCTPPIPDLLEVDEWRGVYIVTNAVNVEETTWGGIKKSFEDE